MYDPDDARGGLAQRGGCIGSGVLRDPVRRDPAVELEPPAVLRVTGSPAVHPIRRASDIAQQRVALGRSEEHTSELQSRGHLVCRLLLEKKKKNKHTKNKRKTENNKNKMCQLTQ